LHDPKRLVTFGFLPTLPFGCLNNFFNLPNFFTFGSLLQAHSVQQSVQQSEQQVEQQSVQQVEQSELHGVQHEGTQHEGVQHVGMQQTLHELKQSGKQLRSQVSEHKALVQS
jgi:hypothetical protein